MCGVFGVISSKATIEENLLEDCTSSLSHRGPDNKSYYLSPDKKIGLGHTRLSILDTSVSANQPYHSSCGRYIMVYNGETYNFQDIAKKLAVDKKKTLKTTGDTEIILNAFIKWGISFVDKLNGMFAIAIWDKQEKKLHLFRDRLGIKPLYVFQDDDLLIFASELKSLIKYPHIKKFLKIDQESFYSFMHLGYIPEPLSIYKGISKFPAGTYASYSVGEKLEQQEYWNIDARISNETISNEKEALPELEKILNQSVKKRLISDVPFGTFLSGGIDSSLVTSIAAQHVDQPLNTFSIGFNDSKFDESTHAKKIASYLKTNHTEFILSEKEAIPYLEKMNSTFDEPFADTSAIPTMLVSKLASEHVKVILTGDGGDEQFLGYGSYDWAQRLEHPFLKNNLVKKSIKQLLLNSGKNRYKRVAHLFDQVDNKNIRSHIFSQEQYLFSQNELSELINNYDESDSFSYYDSKLIKRSAPELQSFFDLKNYLKDDLLVKVDRSSMKFGLECRVPLLDHELVEFNLNIDKKLKKNHGESKYLLKKVLYKYIPETYFDRPKWGFGIPLEKWLKNEMQFLISDYLNESLIKEYNYFNYEYVASLIQRFYNGDSYLYNRLWLMIVWQKWLKENPVAQ